MDRLIYFIVVFIALGIQQNINAQNNLSEQDLNNLEAQINESIFVNTNNNAFVAGETLYYKLYCFNKEKHILSNASKIAYIELFDTNNKRVSKQKIFLNKGIGSGDIFISSNLETGNYKLVGYTNWMLNFKNASFFEISISIINPFHKDTKNVTITKSSLKNSQNNNPKKEDQNSKDIDLTLNKTKFSYREKVNLKIESNNIDLKNGSFSISVKKQDSLSSFEQLNSIQFLSSQKNNSLITSPKKNIPELRGEIIEGKIESKSKTNSVENKTIALSLSGRPNTFKLTKTNKNGYFKFVLDTPNANSNITIQITDSDASLYTIHEIESEGFDTSNLTSSIDLNLDYFQKKYIEERSKASQIENAYYNTKKDSIINSETENIFGQSSEEYKLDNYTRFPSLKETIIEIVNGMYIKKNNNKHIFSIDDKDLMNELPSPVLVLVDGLYVQDIDELLELNPKKIDKINIIRGGYYFGGNLFNGVAMFTTKNFDYETKLKGDFIIKPKILRPQSKKIYNNPDYSNNENLKRIPDYRYQLLWVPELAVNNNDSEINFYTSDISGTFEIVLDGFTSDGKPINVTKTFEVK